MKFLTFDKVSGRIDAAREASGCETEEQILAHTFGHGASRYRAIEWAGEVPPLAGKWIDPRTHEMVDEQPEPLAE